MSVVVAPPAARWSPTREAWQDAAFLLVLCGAALLGLASSFTGWWFLVAGLVGLVLGIGAGLVSDMRRWPMVTPVLLAVLVFYLLGGVVALRPHATLPTPHTWRLLTDQVLYGWKDLLTTLPPVDGDGPLVVLPFALGLFAGATGMMLARVRSGPRWLRAALPLVVPLALLGVVIALGVSRPQSVLVQGVVFSATGLGWVATRGHRTRTAMDPAGAVTRLLLGGALVGLAALVALPVAGWAMGSDTGRVTWRASVEPPYDVGQYPSPLASFRRYVRYPKDPPPENLYDTRLFTISGVPAGTRVRFATLDSYDGTVWGAANRSVPASRDDTYQRVSSTIDNPATGTPVDATVTIDKGYSGVWLPVVGALTSLRFDGGDSTALTDSFRYNLAASAAVVPSGLRAGDRYTFTAVDPAQTLSADDLAAVATPDEVAAGAFLQPQVEEWTNGAGTPMGKVLAAAEQLQSRGKYSDGVTLAERVYYAGHHLRRLNQDFVNAPIMAGNDEQYAATMALLANRIGVPARVVMGAVVPENGVVRGSDVAAWVEVQTADGSWRTLPTDDFMGRERPAKLPPQSRRNQTGATVPPPAVVPPPSVLGEQTEVQVKPRRGQPTPSSDDGSSGLPGWVRLTAVVVGGPLLALLALMAAVVATKVARRWRRRRSGTTSHQIGGAWREYVDHARDLGQAVPLGATVTRREQSARLAYDAAPELARRADAHVFGPAAPSTDAAEGYWADVDAERREMSSGVGWTRRLRAAVNPVTLRHRRR